MSRILVATNAETTVFPQAALRRCRFHLGQSWWRRMQPLGLSEDCKQKKTETPDLNPATTNSCQSYHADFYFVQPIYLSRRYCDNRHPRTFLWRHALS